MRTRVVVVPMLLGISLASVLILLLASCGPSNAAEISITEFLMHKENGKVKEVWIEGDREGGEIVAEMYVGYIREGREYKYVRAAIPPGHISDPEAFEKLTEHIEPSKVHYEKP